MLHTITATHNIQVKQHLQQNTILYIYTINLISVSYDKALLILYWESPDKPADIYRYIDFIIYKNAYHTF